MPTTHSCVPDLETMRILRAGEASSIRATCLLCTKQNVWIQRVTDGAIVALEMKGAKR